MSAWKHNRLRMLRAERRMIQFLLAQKIGVSQSTVSMWEQAYIEPSDDDKRRLAKALGVPVSALVPQSLPEAHAS